MNKSYGILTFLDKVSHERETKLYLDYATKEQMTSEKYLFLQAGINLTFLDQMVDDLYDETKNLRFN